MIIQKVFNNNVASVLNSKGQECVVIGKGIAYRKKCGDTIDVTNAVKIFRSSGKGLGEKLSTIVDNIPFEHVKVCNEIVATARGMLDQVDDKIFLTLIDHISFAIDRHNQGIAFADTLWEIQRLYPHEHNVGLMALDVIEHRLGVRLPENEATLIAFHFLNANGTSAKSARDSLKLIEAILRIVQAHFNMDIDENATEFARFLTHLRFFAGRVLDTPTGKTKPEIENQLLSRLLHEMSVEKACVDEITAFVEVEYHRTVSADEKSYLIIHINSITKGFIGRN